MADIDPIHHVRSYDRVAFRIRLDRESHLLCGALQAELMVSP